MEGKNVLPHVKQAMASVAFIAACRPPSLRRPCVMSCRRKELRSSGV